MLRSLLGTWVLGVGLLSARAAPVRGQIDWQAHPAMHLPWKIYGPGLTELEPRRTARHGLSQTMHAPYVHASGVRILLAGAMAAEKARSPEQARALILAQLAYVEDFVQRNGERYALARTPGEARRILETTDKTVVVHSIEGGRMLLSGPEDAAFWAERGVALITLIHLVDDELGAAADNGGLLGGIINPAARRKARRGEARGLTGRGRAAIVELDEAGVLVDLTHMAPEAFAESLDLMEAEGIPPVITHGKVASIQAGERSFTEAEILRIYALGGSFNLALSGPALDPVDPSLPVPADFCPGTLDAFRWHHQTVQALLAREGPALLGATDGDELSEDQRIALATGWSSDWNGGIGHSRPRYGLGRCRPLSERPAPPLEFDTRGLAHPGLLPQHWQRLEEAGVDLGPMHDSAEQFLRLWERVRGE